MRPELAITTLLACVLAGCAGTAERGRPAEPVQAIESVQSVQMNSLLTALRTVVAGTPTEQAEVMAAARQQFDTARYGPAAVRYGLLLAAPGHPQRDPAQAQQVLWEAVARRELLSSMEYAMAVVELERVAAELRLDAENQRLMSEAQQERERARNAPSTATLTRQLQTANEQNAQLRRELEEARAKLDAIAEFERRQADRPPAGGARNP